MPPHSGPATPVAMPRLSDSVEEGTIVNGDGQVTPTELAGGTFTVSNLGMYGITNFQPVINSPQGAILAVGEIAASGTMGVTLACDHRILYGADAARFLGRVRGLLEEPLGLAL